MFFYPGYFRPNIQSCHPTDAQRCRTCRQGDKILPPFFAELLQNSIWPKRQNLTKLGEYFQFIVVTIGGRWAEASWCQTPMVGSFSSGSKFFRRHYIFYQNLAKFSMTLRSRIIQTLSDRGAQEINGFFFFHSLGLFWEIKYSTQRMKNLMKYKEWDGKKN